MASEKALPIIPCSRTKAVVAEIESYSESLRASAPLLGSHGLSQDEFWESGLFRAAVERLRGQQAASMAQKRAFIASILTWLKDNHLIASWESAGAKDRHDYEVHMSSGSVCCIEAKGCLDGNNTNIFQRPPNADEFVIWSLCQNPGADPRKNTWSGIHTRLSAEIVHKGELVDGLIVWDMLCGTPRRPCPKIEDRPERLTTVGDRVLPPPCIYLFPRSRPDPRNNPKPKSHTLAEVEFLQVLARAFRCETDEVTAVEIEAGMIGSTTSRRTILSRGGVEVKSSKMTKVKRAK